MNTVTTKSKQKTSVYLFLTGLGMGAADVVPGVSGGTVAFILGIYDQLLEAVKSVNLAFFKKLLRFEVLDAFKQIPWRFLVPLLFGIGIAIVSLARMIEYLLTEHEIYLMSFFFGLIVASIVALMARTQWCLSAFVGLFLGAGFAYWLVGLVPMDPGHAVLVLFGSGVLAISAMILPGISGSFILLILGQYLHCVSTLNLMIDALRANDWGRFLHHFVLTILPIGLGAVVGLMLFSRFLSWLLKFSKTVTVATLVGFMVGSLRRIWPYKLVHETHVDRHGDEVPTVWENVLPSVDLSLVLALVLLLTGFLVICIVDHVQDKRNPVVKFFFTRNKNPAVGA